MSLLSPSSSLASQTSAFESPWTQNSITNPEDGVRRVTIKQLLTAHERVDDTGSSFFIDQQPLGNFILVANVYTNQILLSTKRVTYGFDDGSGRIKGYRVTTTGYPTFAPFDFAVIVGQLNENNGTSVVKVLHIQPLYDPHEIYFHILHVIFDTLRYERGNPQSEEWSLLESQKNNCPMESMMLSLQNISLDTVDNAERHQVALIGNHGLSELEEDIISCMKDLKEYSEAYDDEMVSGGIGIALVRIVNELKPLSPDMAALDLWDAIEGLLEKGILRTTIDEKHFDFAYHA